MRRSEVGHLAFLSVTNGGSPWDIAARLDVLPSRAMRNVYPDSVSVSSEEEMSRPVEL
jgi:hypothetical protein